MKKNKLYSAIRAFRAKVETAAESVDDTTAQTMPELFPYWTVNREYSVGDRVQYNGKLYKCVQAHTSQADWTPDIVPALWAEVANPAEEYPDWVQPTGAHDAYQTGDKVTHNDKHWVSTCDNNVWAPGVYGWTEVN